MDEERRRESDTHIALNYKWNILSQYGVGFKLDFERLFTTTVLEMILVLSLTTMTLLMNWGVHSGHDDGYGFCACAFVPVLFFIAIGAAWAYEKKLLQGLCSSVMKRLRYIETSPSYRVLQKTVILGVAIGEAYMISGLINFFKGNKIPLMGPSSENQSLVDTLSTWQNYTTQLFGTFALITLIRLYMDVNLLGYKLVSNTLPLRKKDGNREESQKLQENRSPLDDYRNENINRFEEEDEGLGQFPPPVRARRSHHGTPSDSRIAGRSSVH